MIITVNGLKYEVGNDLIREGGSYKIFSGDSAKKYAAARGLIVPPIEVIRELYNQGTKLIMPARNNNPTDTNAEAHTQDIFRVNKLNGFPSGLVVGHKKEVVASRPDKPDKTRIFGGWNGSSTIQSDSSIYSGYYVDYSQGMRTCRIITEGIGNGGEEDLSLEQQYAGFGKEQYDNLGTTTGKSIDPSLQYPKYDNNESSVNRAARGNEINNLNIKKGKPGVARDILQNTSTMYQRAKIDETPGGHIIELNDTPGGERILIKHNSGAGFDIRPDGKIVTSAKTDQIHISGADYDLTVGGDGKLTFYGNLDLDVTGDMNINVGGNFVFKTKGSVVATILGSVTKSVTGNIRETVKGIYQSIRKGQSTVISLSDFTNIVKGGFKQLVQGAGSYGHKGSVSFTGEGEMDMAASSVNLAAQSMSVLGNTGTIGGEGIIMYNKNMHTTKTVWSESMNTTAVYATTFHGSLNGTANFAKKAAVASGKSTGGVPGPVINSVAVDTTATALPNGALMTQYLENSSKGIKKISIDEDDGIAKSIDRSSDNGGVTDRDLDSREVRARMKNPENVKNADFISTQVAAGTLSSSFKNAAPGKVGRVVTTKNTTSVGHTTIGPKRDFTHKRYKQSDGLLKAGKFKVNADPNFNPSNATEITSKTKLNSNVPIATFLGGYGDASNLNHITSLEERKQIARNLTQHANIIEAVDRSDAFNNYFLIVAEGLYKPYSTEKITPNSIVDFRRTGRAIVYEMYEWKTGKENFEKLFELAEFIKDSFQYQELSLRYDNFDPRENNTKAQLVVIMPEIPEDYEANFERKLSTYYNENVQSDEALVELL